MGIEDKKAGLGELLTEAGELSFGWEQEGLSEGEAEAEVSVLSFRVGKDIFGLETGYVREIVGTPVLTALPGAPAHILGILVLRRQVVGVLDLGAFLDLTPGSGGQAGGEGTSRTVIVEVGQYVAGIRVDAVDGLEMWSRGCKRAESVVDVVSERVQRYVQSGCDRGGSLKVLLDLPRLLDDAAVR